jgi:hypothetical protein
MTSALLSRWHLALRIGLFSALAGSLGIACCNCGRTSAAFIVNPQVDTLPSGCSPGSQPRSTRELGACLTGLEFDTVLAVGDEQRLMVVDSGAGPRCHGGDTTLACRYGPLAKIEPVKGAETYSDTALAQGRIIARMFLRPGETESYPKLGLVAGDTTYWWVSTTKDSSYFVHPESGDSNLVPTGRGLDREVHPPGTFQQALARWVWVENDEKANGPCGSGCCKP